MHARHDLADLALCAHLIVGRAQRVVEDDDARGAALGLHQRFHLRIVDAAHLVLVEEVGNLGVVADEAESITLECELLHVWPAVVDDHLPLIDRPAAAPVEAAGPAGLGE